MLFDPSAENGDGEPLGVKRLTLPGKLRSET